VPCVAAPVDGGNLGPSDQGLHRGDRCGDRSIPDRPGGSNAQPAIAARMLAQGHGCAAAGGLQNRAGLPGGRAFRKGCAQGRRRDLRGRAQSAAGRPRALPGAPVADLRSIECGSGVAALEPCAVWPIHRMAFQRPRETPAGKRPATGRGSRSGAGGGMSEKLNPLDFPLKGSRLIEASAGTGKTWTIAALYVRLVLGHGEANAFGRALHPSEILVMTFTRAATRELSDRIRQRLIEAAAAFRETFSAVSDPFLAALLADYTDPQQRLRAAHQLTQAAEAMDEAAIFTIDAWCQRMLREHAFDCGCLFDEELVASEDRLLADAMRDYWRHHVYALEEAGMTALRGCWPDFSALEKGIRWLVPHAA